MDPIAELVDVRRTYDEGRIVALDGVSLAIRAGETVAIAGRSGSGKSTLANLLCGLDVPSSGSVKFDGQIVRHAADWTALRARRIGIVFQQFHLLSTLTAAENVEAPMLGRIGGVRPRRARAKDLLDRVGVPHRVDRYPTELSGGERQRVAIARALANDPELLVADEPTGSLDQANTRLILDLLMNICRSARMALVLVSHDAVVTGICGRRVELVDGRVAFDGPGGRATQDASAVPGLAPKAGVSCML